MNFGETISEEEEEEKGVREGVERAGRHRGEEGCSTFNTKAERDT